MSRQVCCVTMCGLACLTLGLVTEVHGGDRVSIYTVGSAIQDQGDVAGVPQVMEPMFEGVTTAPLAAGPYSVGRLGIVPKGTLGQTYTRVSHPVPLDKHPRTGMLAVKDDGSIQYLTVGVMGGIKMKNGIWLFESTRPLDPGACQIVRVEARETPQDVEPYATRFVRLIPGRIVYLEF
ncbi:MAG: hypothetical protein O2856_10655 [Planctomycetota bacterium]|nr:hypothetical protein [Planctomycetota bacterium]